MTEFEPGKWTFDPTSVRIIGVQVEGDGTVLFAFEVEYEGNLAYFLADAPPSLLSAIMECRGALISAVTTGLEIDNGPPSSKWN